MKKRNFCVRTYIGNISHPKNSIYITTSSEEQYKPWKIFGGQSSDWEQIKDTFLLAAGDHFLMDYHSGEASGGSETKTILASNLPPHQHRVSGDVSWKELIGTFAIPREENNASGRTMFDYSGIVSEYRNSSQNSLDIIGQLNKGRGAQIDASHKHSLNIDSENGPGSSTPLDIMPPYTTVYVWRRLELADVYTNYWED